MWTWIIFLNWHHYYMDTHNPIITERVANVLEYFDFDRVHSILDFLQEEWPLPSGEVGIPSAEDLEEIARGLLYEVAGEDCGREEDCRLVASTCEDGTLVLEFIPESSGE